VTILQDANEERQLEANERTDDEHDEMKERAQRRVGIHREEKHGHGEAADDGERDLGLHEARRRARLEPLRDPGTDAHREEVRAEDERELKDGIAEEKARERPAEKLVDERTDRDEKNVREKGKIAARCRVDGTDARILPRASELARRRIRV
jgi:hypothetical protein